ncbi:hypothetical protein [Spongiibacter sp. UBA1325]|uniref:hypothetical protein n=1 Tax=Spongiibacter sp. UBA1325 TaxID=1947543 RepID=UPI00257F84FD|nr:hypothetical protein [Spongiibacter sp. UBA1325]|tara:strand:- start:169 stop:798 length:630 start_codon:yes stop_codon:yes gene_type:complete
MNKPTTKRGRRKPIQMELIGGKPARQRIWEQIREHRDNFTIYTIARRADADDETVKTYLHALLKGGYIVQLTNQQFVENQYSLIKDTGAEAPRLDRQGNPVLKGRGQENMWRCLRTLGPMDARQLAEKATTPEVRVKESSAVSYVRSLKRAKYLQVVEPCDRNRGRREVICLIPHMNTGPRPPQVQRVKTVYDPNLNKVMCADDPQELL